MRGTEAKATSGLGVRPGLLLTLALISLAAVGWLNYQAMQTAAETNRLENHSYVEIDEFDKLLSSVQDAEIGQRGFLINGEKEYLETYRQALGRLKEHLNGLRTLTQDNARQAARLETIERLIRARVEGIERALELHATKGPEAAYELVRSGRGKQLMDQIRDQITQAQDEENRVLQQRSAAYNLSASRLFNLQLAGAIFAGILLIGAFALLKQQMLVRHRMEVEARKVRDQLAAELAAMNQLHELGTRFMQQGDQQTLLKAILDAGIAITGASKGNIQLLNAVSGELDIAVHHGFDQAFVDYFSHIRAGQAACGTAMQTRQCVVVEDVTVSPMFLAEPKAMQFKLAAGIRALICTPLLTQTGPLVGVLSVHFKDPHRPSDRDLRLLDLLARQAADFIERKQAETRLATQARLEQFRADVAQTLQSVAETPVLLQRVSRLITERLEAAFSRIWTLDPSGRTLLLQASEGQYTHLNGPHSRIRVGQFKIGRIAQEGRPHLTNQVIGDTQVHDQEWAKREGLVAFAGYPLLMGDRLLGVLALFARHELSPEVHQSLGAVSNLLAQALARKEAEDALREAKDELVQANEELEHKVQERTAKLEETVNELEHFSYTITHDMRAPLRAMQGLGHVLLSESAESLHPQRREFLRKIAESAGRMDALITDALNYTKIVRKDFPLEPVDTANLLRGMVESYPQFQSPKAEIQIEGDLPVVLGNEAGLTQCFSNILSNAVKFVQPGQVPKVRVWAERRGEYARFWFEDNGIGIAKDYQAQIFVMFQRLSKTYEGTGIGLALVSKAVERMQGKLGVESEEGQGSKFWIELKTCEPLPVYGGEAAAVCRR